MFLKKILQLVITNLFLSISMNNSDKLAKMEILLFMKYHSHCSVNGLMF
jgi:hypothetical protein